MSFIVTWYRVPQELVNQNIIYLEQNTEFDFPSIWFHGLGDLELQELRAALSELRGVAANPLDLELHTEESYFGNIEEGDSELDELGAVLSELKGVQANPLDLELDTAESYFGNIEEGTFVFVVADIFISEIVQLKTANLRQVAEQWLLQETTASRFAVNDLLETLVEMHSFCRQYDREKEKIVSISCI